MDPLTIIGGVAAAAGIVATITKTIKGLSDLQTKYTNADMSIRQLMGQLMIIKASLIHIQDWTENLHGSPRERDLVEAFNISLDGCQEAMEAMCDEVTRLVQDALAGDKRTMRARYVWNEETMKDHQGRIDSQVQALQLLLSAVQCTTASEQTALLRKPENRRIVEKVRDDTSSLRANSVRNLNIRTQSILSHGNETIGSTEFEMDNELINTRIYRQAMARQRARSADERHRRMQGERTVSAPTNNPGLASPDSGSAEWSEDHVPPLDPRFTRRQETRAPVDMRPKPYERSVVSQRSDVTRQNRPQLHITPAMDNRLAALNLTPRHRVQKKASFLTSLFNPSSTSLLSPTSPNASRTMGHRKGRRRHSDTDIHLSIDLGSNEGRNAPLLVQAAQSGSGTEVEELLDQRVNIEERHERTKRTALAVASHCGNDGVVDILLRHGANCKTVDAYGMTPLHLAAVRGHYRVVEYLLREDVNVDASGPDQKTALRLAADNGHFDVVELLLNNRAKVNARDARNLTALHSVARSGDDDIVALLLSYKADVEAKDGNFQAAIHHASEHGHDGIVDILLTKKANIEAVGKESMSPLTAACAAGSTDVVRLLLQKKASIKHKGDGAMTCLHWASYNGHSDVVDLLLEKKITVDPRTADGRTPLHLAVMSDKFATAELLLRKGAHVDVQCDKGLRPLHYAAQRSNADLLQLLLGHGASLEAETRIGQRALHFASLQGKPTIIDLLLRRGASVDARDGAGDRALCLASAEGHVEAVRLLLDSGSEMRTRYARGPSHEDSPLCIAAKNGHLPIVEEFVQRGASVRQRDESNWQPLRYASYYAHPEVVQYLLACGASVSGLDTPGSFGFNLTAARIGFAKSPEIDEFRRQSVLMLLHDAEVREQESVNNAMRRNPTVHSPRQAFPAEKSDDNDWTTAYQPTVERQELPSFQRSPRLSSPTQHDTETETESETASTTTRTTHTTQTAATTPPREETPPPVSHASRFTLDPNSSSQPQWRPVVPPIPPSAPRVPHFESSVSPMPSSLFDSVSPMAAISPLPSQSIETPLASSPPPHTHSVPQSPNRAPPPPPVPQSARADSITSVDSLYAMPPPSRPAPPPPTRAAPHPPETPPIPDPSEAIVVCDNCSSNGRTATDVTCSGCRQALYMYHHIMNTDYTSSTPAVDNFMDYQLPAMPTVRQPVFELA